MNSNEQPVVNTVVRNVHPMIKFTGMLCYLIMFAGFVINIAGWWEPTAADANSDFRTVMYTLTFVSFFIGNICWLISDPNKTG